MNDAKEENKTLRLPIETSVSEESESLRMSLLNVEDEVLVKFLVLFRDHYRKCEKATAFLENRTGLSNISGIANKRDALSHFATALQPGMSLEERHEQYICAEEHIRRSIFEPYELALGKVSDQLIDVSRNYSKIVVPLLGTDPKLESLPSQKEVDETIESITQLRDEARSAKGQNKWDNVWEEGVEKQVEAFYHADTLYKTLRFGIYQAEHSTRDTDFIKEIEALKTMLKQKDSEIKKLKAE